MSEVNVLDRLTSRKVEVKTDHGGFGIGDLVVIALGLVLLCYTGYRTWHVLSTTVVTDAEVIAVLGLWGLDIGAVAWSVVWIFGSTTFMQNVVSISMWVIDLIGMIGTSLVDTLTPVGKMPEGMATIIFYAVTFIIAGNVIVGFVYHMTSPHTRKVRAERKMQEEITREREKEEFALRKQEMEAQLELDKQRMQLEQSERLIQQRQVLIERMQQVAGQKVRLDGIELGLAKVLDDKSHTEGISERIRQELGDKLASTSNGVTTSPPEEPKNVNDGAFARIIGETKNEYLERVTRLLSGSKDGNNGHSDPN